MKTAIEFFRSKQFLIRGSSTKLQARCLRPPESGTRSYVAASTNQQEKPCWQKDLELLEGQQSHTGYFARLRYLLRRVTLAVCSIYIWIYPLIRRRLAIGQRNKSQPQDDLED